MTNSKGYKHGTRTLFSCKNRKHGLIPLSKNLMVYKKGDLVSIRVTGSMQKGMAHKCFHGKTGRVFNVAKRAVGVIINKTVKGRIIQKKVYVRVEHVTKNRSREEFVKRVHMNEKLRREAKAKGVFVQLKRLPEQPRPSHLVRVTEPVALISPIPYEFIA